MDGPALALELFGSLVALLIGVAFLASSIALHRRNRDFTANAHATRLRVERVEARPSGRKQAGRNLVHVPHFQVLDGPHVGTIAQPAGVGGRWRGTEGRVYDGWFDPRSGNASSRSERLRAALMLPVTIALGVGLVWFGLSSVLEEFR